MQIYFLRHANAGEPKINPLNDAKRKLDQAGIEQCHNVGLALAALKVTLDAVIASPLQRAVETATLVANEIGDESKVVIDEALQPGATYEEFQALLERHSGNDAILVVGHNPNLTDFLNRLLTGDEILNLIDLKKAAVAKVEKEGHSPAMLKWYMPPKVIRSLQQASASSSRPKTVSK